MRSRERMLRPGLRQKRAAAYADCFASALAKGRSAALVTGDSEFKRFEEEIIVWIQRAKGNDPGERGGAETMSNLKNAGRRAEAVII